MTVVRQYFMQAAEGREDALRAALIDLAAAVTGCTGCEKVEIFADARDTGRYAFVENWRSTADREAASAKLGKPAFAPVFEALSGKPESHDLVPIQV